MMKHELFLFACLLFVLASPAAEAQPPQPQPPEVPQNQDNCTYTITVETTCEKKAGTSRKVRIRFQDENDEITVKRLHKKYVRTVKRAVAEPEEATKDLAAEPFQSCMIDEFEVTGNCLQSQISEIFFQLVGDDDDWRPGSAWVNVVNNTHLNSEIFCFRKKVPPNKWDGGDPCMKNGNAFEIRRPSRLKKSSNIKRRMAIY